MIARSLAPSCVVLLTLSAAGSSCGDESGGSASNGRAGASGASGVGGSSASSGASGTSGSDGGGATGGTVSLDGGSEGGELGCSADLRSVIDANGDVVEACAADRGCAGGACVAACEAAAASGAIFGCDFRVPTPGTYGGFSGPPCFAVFVANTWPSDAKLTVTRGATTLDPTTFGRMPVAGQPESAWPAVPAAGVPPDGVAVLFLSSDPTSTFTEKGLDSSCPITPAIDASTFLDATGTADAFRVTSSAPISAYDIVPYGGALSHVPSAELLLPTPVWGTNYVVIATPPGTHSAPGPLWMQILGHVDGTVVEVLPSVALPSGTGVVAAPAGATATFNVDAGQYIQWQLPPGSLDTSGTIVQSSEPVAVFAGNRFYRDQPTPGPGGEGTHQQILPVSALAIEYVAAPYDTRRADLAPESIEYRVVGTVDGTTLAYDPAVAGAPATLAQAEVVDFEATGPFRVKSQDDAHPFALAQTMDTANIPGGSRPGAIAPGYGPNLGDEEFVIALPPAQFLSRYVFFTDPSYPTTSLVVTRVAGATGFADVHIGCIGPVGGWQPVGTEGRFEVTAVDLLRANVASGTCSNGWQEATSDAPFGIVVWGLDSYSSYAYPAGGNAAELTTVVVPATPK